MQSAFQRSYAGLAVLLAALAMLGPFSIDTYLPAFSSIQQSLHASSIQVQQTLTAYMLSFSIMTLWHGALSDAFGRRRVILLALAVFATASLGCALANDIRTLWLFRIAQGVSAGAGMVIGRAIIRDCFEGASAERLLSLVTMIFSTAPAIAPILGGWIVGVFAWHAIFVLLFGYTIILFFACYRWLPETLALQKRQPFQLMSLLKSYRQVFYSKPFLCQSGTVAFNFAGLFLYISSAPVFITKHLHLGNNDFGWQFIPSVGGIFFGALIANRLAGRMTIWKQVSLGFKFMALAVVFNVSYHVFYAPEHFFSVIPLFFYTLGMSIVAPGATLKALDLFPKFRGIAASCQSALTTLLSALVAGLIAPVMSSSVLLLAIGQLIFAVLGALLWRIGKTA